MGFEMQEEEQVLSNVETWDLDQIVVSPGAQKPRAVVSVSFNRADFERVADAAHRSDMKTSEFIRTASLDKASVATKVTLFGLVGTSQVGFITNFNAVVFAGTSIAAPIYKSHDEEMLLTANVITSP